MATTHRVRQVSTNKWLQIIHSTDPPMSEAAVREHGSVVFGVAVGDLRVVTTDWTTAARESAAQEMASGQHDGLGVVMAPVSAPPIDLDTELASAIRAVDTAGIVDPASKRAMDDLKAALLGTVRPSRVKGGVL